MSVAVSKAESLSRPVSGRHSVSTLDTLCLPLTGLFRDSALDTATDMGTAAARGPLSLSMGQQSLLRTTT